MEPLIRGASLRGFAALVRELAGDPEAFVHRFEIPSAALSSDEMLISITAHDLMLEAAAHELGCSDLGLRLARQQDLSILGPLAVAIEASAKASEAIDCVSKFMFVHSPALGITLGPDPHGQRDVVALTYRKNLGESPYCPQAMELGVGLVTLIAQALATEPIPWRSVEFAHAPVSPMRIYAEFFGREVKFGCSATRLRAPRSVLDQQLLGADSAVRDRAVDHLTGHYIDPQQRISTQVRRVLTESLGVMSPTVGNVARLLAMHPRTLQRRLADESTTFDAVLNGTRRDLAIRYITTTNMPLGRVAAMTGFCDQSSLSHAVRRWRALSPRELRRQAQHRTQRLP